MTMKSSVAREPGHKIQPWQQKEFPFERKNDLYDEIEK